MPLLRPSSLDAITKRLGWMSAACDRCCPLFKRLGPAVDAALSNPVVAVAVTRSASFVFRSFGKRVNLVIDSCLSFGFGFGFGHPRSSKYVHN
jgi:hypothetical protein